MAKSIRDLIPPFIRAIDPYPPGKPIEEAEREFRATAIKLASNENPLGPSPRAIEAAREALGQANRYPDGSGHDLRESLAARLKIPLDHLILGGGSTDLIDLAARTLLQTGDDGVASAGSFPMYYISIRAAGARLIAAPLDGYDIDLSVIAEAITPRAKIVYLANPNNPTGTMFTADEFEVFLARLPEDILVAIDEAYFDYVERPNYSRSLDLVRSGRHILVLRTFSKVYGLAGLRIGYGIGPPELIAEMNKIRSPFNTSSIGQAAALAALDDREHVRRSIESNRSGLEMLAEGLTAQGVRFVPSLANFLLVELGSDAEAVTQALLTLGVIVRPMRWMGFPNAIRVTVGTRAETQKFLQALAQVHTPADEPQPL
jgi:histidinol-phosphate aminotransferase